MKPILVFLTCANKKEADKIIRILLSKRLIVCAKSSPVTSSFLWKQKMSASKEILVIMDTSEELYSEIEKEIKRVHSYETFVIMAIPVVKTSEAVRKWLQTELKTG